MTTPTASGHFWRQPQPSPDCLFLAPLTVMPFDAAAVWSYGDLRAALERRGTPIGSLDAMIAAHALSQQALLVTNNTREFAKVPGLQLDNWVADA